MRLGFGRCACGRTAPRVRCIGRTDDMLIVRGVNLFPTALREIVNEFAPGDDRRGDDQAEERRRAPGPAAAGEGRGRRPSQPELAERIRARVREALLVTTEIELVAAGGVCRAANTSPSSSTDL